MAFSLTWRRVPVYFSQTSFQGSVATLSTGATTTRTSVPHTNQKVGQLHLLNVPGNQSSIPQSSIPASSENEDYTLSRILSRLSLSPAEVNLTNEYLFPSLFPATERATILDPLPSAHVRDCPTHVIREIMECPLRQKEVPLEAPPSARRAPEKRAKRIMKIRRKKMKKHKYLKWKKRNKFMLRAMFAKRKKKKQKLWEERLESYRFKGLTQDHIDRHMARVKEESALFLKHLGIPVEEEETSEENQEHGLVEKRKGKELNARVLPQGTVRVTPAPILPEGASLGRAFLEQEMRAKELTGMSGKLTDKRD